MATKLTYQRREGGGRYKGSTIPGDKKVTEAEQRIIKYLEQTRKQTKEVRRDFRLSTEGVMKNEAENRQTLQNLRTDLWKTKKDNIRIRRDTEVDYYEGLAKQAGEEAQFWAEFSPTLGKNIEDFGLGLWDAASYYRDRGILRKAEEEEKERRRQEEEREGEHSTDQCGRDYDDPEYGQPCDPDAPREEDETETVFEPDEDEDTEDTAESLRLTAENNILGESQKNQIKLAKERDFKAAEVLKQQTWGASINTPFWGTYHTRQAASTFEEDWPQIVAFATEGTDPSKQGEDLIEASFFQWAKHKGISLESIGGKEVTRKFKKKLAAYSTGRVQQELVANDDKTRNGLVESLNTAIKNDTGVQQVLNQLVLHDAHAHVNIGGKYSSPLTRVQNYGTTFDSIAESILTLYPFSNFEEFQDKILSLKVLPLDSKLHNIPVDHPAYASLKTWGQQREHMLDTYKDIFRKNHDAGVKFERANAAKKIASRIQELNERVTDKKRDDYINPQTEDGINQIWALMKSAESTQEQNFLGALIQADPTLNVAQANHVGMLRGLRQGDESEFLFYYNRLSDKEKAYYDGISSFKSTHELIKSGTTYETIENWVETNLQLRLDEAFSQDNKHISLESAVSAGVQRFYDINNSIPIDDTLAPHQRLANIKKQLSEEFKDETGLWALDDTGSRAEFKHFQDNTKYETSLYSEQIIKDLPAKATIGDINKLDLIPEQAGVNIIKDIIHGADGIRLPKILFTVSRETGIPLVDIVNGQLNREGIADKYDYKANMVSGNSNSLLRATQIEYLKAKAPPESTIDQTAKPENIPALSALFDLYRMFSPYDMLQRGMKKYHDNRDQSAVDSLELSYEIRENNVIAFADPEQAIRKGQEVGFVYNPFSHNYGEIT